jgi:Ca2+/Na+ antiporter
VDVQKQGLGRLVSVHVIAPAYVQRAVFVAVLAFMFFMTMMFAFYVLQSALYFLLSTAFLIVYLLTMFSIVIQRRSNVEIYENGIKYKKNSLLWEQISAIGADGTIKAVDKRKNVRIPTTLADFDTVLASIRRHGPVAE